jgi:DNA modification methylase
MNYPCLLIKKIIEISPSKYNPRTISDESMGRLTKSLAEFGNIQPITWNARTGNVVGGHQRLKVYQAMGKTEVEVWAVDLSEQKEKAANIALNKLSGEFDMPMLKDILEEIDTGDLDMEVTGFAMDEIAEMMESVHPIEEDEVPEVPVDAITKLGDLWLLGEHRVLCGDSTSEADVSRLMNGKQWDIIATSPPYNQGESNGDLLHTKGLGVGKKQASLYTDKNSDNRTSKEYYDFCINILTTANNFKNQKLHSVCWNVAYNSKSRDDYGKIVFSELNPFRVKETIIWDKTHSINLPQIGIYSRKCEFIFVMSSNEKYKTSQQYNDCRWNYWQIKSAGSQITGEKIEHRAAFPIGLAVNIIKDFSIQNDLVYEPFCGSGTTIIAAEQLGRKCYGMEISPNYCDVIVKRWENLTNKKATLAK